MSGLGVAFVLASYAPDTPAGMERATAALAHGLRGLGHRALVITARPQQRADKNVIELYSLAVRFPCDDLSLRRAIDRSARAIRAEITGILDRHRIDIVVYVDALWGFGRAMADHPARKVLAVHVIGHPEDLAPALADAEAVIAPSASVLTEAAAWGHMTEDWQVVPNGLLHEAVGGTTEMRDRLRLHGPLRILARPAENKGVLDLLETMPHGLSRPVDVVMPAAPFDIDPGVQQSIITRCTLAARPPIRLSTRPLPWDQAPGWLSRAAVVIVPSRAETFGLVAAEAMSGGTPVVARDVDNLPALIGSGTQAGGITVDHAADSAELWQAALALLEDRLTYLSTSRAAYYSSRDFRPTSIAEHFMKAVW
ncbi:iron(II)-dependent oxidoreductase [Thermomonospora echinospora]|uniref:Iron(II)-dependent oxidoreductase n=1 Tax=Thermomonospora echinospora TaxID=1992 RepID=A0A1H6E815_9ACTN|nr:glycosyltransferase family 4 protein [Thermomonospora echinospora]SEG93872.1 iron(II)-dependent oxidoreductase [Thermomonospora echinospora]